MTDDLTRLLLDARDGDRLALASFIRRTQGEVWRLCRFLVDNDSADDVTQDVYLRAWRALPRYRGDAPARSWLLTIARRACADAIRVRVRRRRVEVPGSATHPGAKASHVDDTTNVTVLHELIRSLDPDQRSAFVLTQMLGLSYAEVAEICGCPIGTIRSRVSRARAELARLWRSDDDHVGEIP